MDCTDSVLPKPSGPAKAPTLPKSAARKEMPPVAVSAGQTLVMTLTLSLPEGTKLTEEAPSCWALSAEGETKFNHCYWCRACKMFFIQNWPHIRERHLDHWLSLTLLLLLRHCRMAHNAVYSDEGDRFNTQKFSNFFGNNGSLISMSWLQTISWLILKD